MGTLGPTSQEFRPPIVTWPPPLVLAKLAPRTTVISPSKKVSLPSDLAKLAVWEVGLHCCTRRLGCTQLPGGGEWGWGSGMALAAADPERWVGGVWLTSHVRSPITNLTLLLTLIVIQHFISPLVAP